MIGKMIFRLMAEQKDEDDHKNWSDKELEKTGTSIADEEDEIGGVALSKGFIFGSFCCTCGQPLLPTRLVSGTETKVWASGYAEIIGAKDFNVTKFADVPDHAR